MGSIESEKLLQTLKDRIEENQLDVDFEKITQAYILAYESHIGQKRRSGEDYILHPIEVAIILADMRMDTDTIVAGILHDIVEDTWITLPDLEYTFGTDVRKLVDGVTKLRNLPRTDTKKIENIRKMVLAMSQDIRVVIIKLADRLHNMRTLKYMSPEKQKEKSVETLEIFAPIAHRIGMAKIKWELEDISFRYLNPEEYKNVRELVNSKRAEREEYTQNIINIVSKELEKHKIKATVTGRPKHLYSIYKKMIEKEKKFADLNDLIAIRILVDKEVECYNVLGIIHNLFVPVLGRFKDYIAVPKSNNYQSIHTTVKGPNNQNVEIQIRTHEMHSIAEDGVAAHWKYKERNSKNRTSSNVNYSDYRKQVEDTINRENSNKTNNTDSSENFVKEITGNVLNTTIFIFTPKGEVMELPNGSTALDFAFHVHTQIGYRTIGAKINDKIAQLDQILENGDKVEILTSKHAKGPGADWIYIVNNPSSKAKIRKWFKDKEFDEKSAEGEQLLDREFEKMGLKWKDIKDEEKVYLYMQKFNINTFDTLCYRFAIGDLSLEGFLKKFEPEEKKEIQEVLEEETEKGIRRKERSQGGVTILGTENTMYKFAKCCSPLPGDDIRGYVTAMSGITIHRADCENFKHMMKNDPNREIDVHWDKDAINNNTTSYQYNFSLRTFDRTGLLYDILRILNEYKMDIVNVSSSNIKENGNKLVLIHLGVMIKRREELDRMLNTLSAMKDVLDVIRK